MRRLFLPILALQFLLVLHAQPDVVVVVSKGTRPIVAVPDFPGTGGAQGWMAAFNQTLWSDLEDAGILQLVSKSRNYQTVPRQPSEFRVRAANDSATSGGGAWISDWAAPPVSSEYLAFGYADLRKGGDGDLLVLHGWLFDVRQATTATAQVLGKFYLGPVSEAGARKVGHEFAADLIRSLGGSPVFGTKIFFRSNRTGHSEVWVMDPDGRNQRQLTDLKSILVGLAAAPDGGSIAFTSFAEFYPKVFVYSVDPARRQRFDNPKASLSKTPSFSPDGKQIIYASSVHGCCRLFLANRDGSHEREIAPSDKINSEPKINPKNGNELVFTSDRSGLEQVYRMNLDGTDVQRLTPGTGEASNPAWSPDGQHLAFAWTKGFAPGAFNIFVTDVAKGGFAQLTREGRNENPSWAPDGIHIVFGSTRSSSAQIWSMLADGTQFRQLTGTAPGEGKNDMPVWSK